MAPDLATWLVEKRYVKDRQEAVVLGEALVEHHHIVHVVRDHTFKDEHLFFNFMTDTRDRGHVLIPENGEPPKSWKMFLEGNEFKQVHPEELKEMLQGVSTFADQPSELPHVMLDEINCEMYDNVRPL